MPEVEEDATPSEPSSLPHYSPLQHYYAMRHASAPPPPFAPAPPVLIEVAAAREPVERLQHQVAALTERLGSLNERHYAREMDDARAESVRALAVARTPPPPPPVVPAPLPAYPYAAPLPARSPLPPPARSPLPVLPARSPVAAGLTQYPPPELAAGFTTEALQRKCQQVRDFIRTASPDKVGLAPMSPEMAHVAAQLDRVQIGREAGLDSDRCARYNEQRHAIGSAVGHARAVSTSLPFMQSPGKETEAPAAEEPSDAE